MGCQLGATIRCHYEEEGKPAGTRQGLAVLHMGIDAQLFVTGSALEFLTSHGNLYVIQGKTIDAYYPRVSEDSMRDPARLAREVLYNSLPYPGWHEIHASAIARNGKAIAFVGSKGTGKSTILCNMLSQQYKDSEFDFVTNDRLWVGQENGQWTGLGSPSPVLIGYGTLATVCELAERLSLYRDEFFLLTGDWGKKVYQFSPSELARVFGRNIQTSVELLAIVNLRRGPNNLLVPI